MANDVHFDTAILNWCRKRHEKWLNAQKSLRFYFSLNIFLTKQQQHWLDTSVEPEHIMWVIIIYEMVFATFLFRSCVYSFVPYRALIALVLCPPQTNHRVDEFSFIVNYHWQYSLHIIFLFLCTGALLSCTIMYSSLLCKNIINFTLHHSKCRPTDQLTTYWRND